MPAPIDAVTGARTEPQNLEPAGLPVPASVQQRQEKAATSLMHLI